MRSTKQATVPLYHAVKPVVEGSVVCAPATAVRACLFTVRNEQVVPHVTVVVAYYLAFLVQHTMKGYHYMIRMVPSVFM